jgi:hypothetical protein
MNVVCLIFCVVLLAVPATAQFVEVAAEIEITNWHYQEETGLPLKTRRTVPLRCVVGTNHWLIEYQPRTNVTDTTWFLNGKIIRQIHYQEDAASEETGFRTFRRPRQLGVIESVDGYPGGELVVNVSWFAFCSGPFLQRSTRGAPVPASAPDRMAFGFTNELSVFSDRLALPRRAVFYATPRQIKCDYQVQQSTNVLDWSFPAAFTVMQNEPDNLGKWSRQLSVAGRIVSVRPARPIELPEDLQERLEYRDQFPARRR